MSAVLTASAPAAPRRSTTPSRPSASELHEEEIRALEAPYTPRHDFQGISDDAQLLEIMKRLPQFTSTS